MFQQTDEATLTLLLTMLAFDTVTRFMPATERSHRGKRIHSVAVQAGVGLGMVSSLALAIINAQIPRSMNHQTVDLSTLLVTIVLTILFLALIAVRPRCMHSLLPSDVGDEAQAVSSINTAVSGNTLIRIAGTLYITAALFRAVPTAVNQTVMMLSGGIEIYPTPVTLTLVGYMLVWMLVRLVT